MTASTAPEDGVHLREHRYILADVFTREVFAGNPLAVFPDATGLDGHQMQLIARELNLSETVFMLPPRSPSHSRQLRIFTPAREMAFAGHPTIGAAIVLAELGGVELERGAGEIIFEEPVGAVPVTIRTSDGRRVARLTAPRIPVRGPAPPSPDALAALLSLTPADLVAGESAAAYSGGEPFLFIRLRHDEAVSAASLDPIAWKATLSGWWAQNVYPFALDAERRRVRSRMFGPALGIAEDAATGGAAVALAGYLAEQCGLGDGDHRWTIEQGIEMGRPSTLHLELQIRDGALVRVELAGEAVLYGEGTLRVSAATADGAAASPQEVRA